MMIRLKIAIYLGLTNVLSFYLHVPKCCLPLQTFWAGPKIELHLGYSAFSTAPKDFVSAQKLNGNRLLVWYRDRLSLVWYKKFGIYTICQSIIKLAQKVWTIPKSFGTCRRPWQKSLI